MSNHLINPLAATNEAAFNAAFSDAVNDSVEQLSARADEARGLLDAALAEAGDNMDMAQVQTLKADTPTETLGRMIDVHSALSAYEDLRAQKIALRRQVNALTAEDPGADSDHVTALPRASRQTLSSAVERALRASGVESFTAAVQRRSVLEIGPEHGIEAAVVTTSAGYSPQVLRTGTLIQEALAPPTLLDVIPIGSTTQNAIKYMAEDVSDGKAAFRAEGGLLPEATFTWSEVDRPIRSIGHYIPVTEEQLADAPMVRGMLDRRMMVGLRNEINKQLALGNNTGNAIAGLATFAPDSSGTVDDDEMNRVLVNQDDYDDTDSGQGFMRGARELITQIRLNGQTTPNVILMHPTALQQVQLSETESGGFYMGDPRFDFGRRLWGLPIVEDQYWLSCTPTTRTVSTETHSEGFTDEDVPLMVADMNYCEAFFRQGIRVEFGMQGDDFIRLQQTIRAHARIALAMYRVKAFGVVVGTD